MADIQQNLVDGQQVYEDRPTQIGASKSKTRIQQDDEHSIDDLSAKNVPKDKQLKELEIENQEMVKAQLEGQDGGSEKVPQKQQSKQWIIFAFAATICFTACNTAISEITARSGPLCILYFSLGSLLSGAIYNFLHCFKNCRTQGKFWLDQNIIVEGKFQFINFLGFIVFSLLYFMVQNMAFLTMWFAALAQVNVGLITVIWSINPLYMAAADYFLFNQKLKCYHLVGTVLIVACTILLSLKPILITEEEPVAILNESVRNEAPQILKDGEVLPIWVPVLFGILTPVAFCSSNTLLRYLTDEEKGIRFNGTTISMSSIFVVNLIILIFAINFWQSHQFSYDLFWIGLAGSIINTIGLTCMNTAISCGPMGPVSSIGALANIFLVIVEAIKLMKVPSYIELISLILGFAGALELVIPDTVHGLLRCIFTCGMGKKNKKSN